MDLKKQYTDFIKSKSLDLGFMSCGISKSGFLASEADRFESWLKNNYHGKMSYIWNEILIKDWTPQSW